MCSRTASFHTIYTAGKERVLVIDTNEVLVTGTNEATWNVLDLLVCLFKLVEVFLSVLTIKIILHMA